jgi:hypothetical protein
MFDQASADDVALVEDADTGNAMQGDLLFFVTRMRRLYADFMVREWQADAIEHALEALAAHRPVMVTASVGTGKTYVALGCGVCLLGDASAYKAKVLFLSPLVALAREQVELFKAYLKATQTHLPKSHRGRACLLAGKDHGDVRRGQLIAATYEHGRNLLGNAAAAIYPGSRLDRTYADAIRLVVIDEIHNICGSRGGVISMIIGLCVFFHIPIMMMTGTNNTFVTQRLQESFQQTMLVVDNTTRSLCAQVPLRIDDEACLMDIIGRATVRNALLRRQGHGLLVFMRTVQEVYPRFQTVCLEVLRQLKHEATTNELGHADVATQQLGRYQGALRGDIPSWLQVGASGLTSHVTTQDALQAAVAAERRNAWVAWQLGVAYNWRDIGADYTRHVMQAFAQGTIFVIVTTATLATGVNVVGVRNVVIWSRDFGHDEVAQMIGRCGRQALGFAFLFFQDPPTHQQVLDAVPPPIQHVARDAFTWLLLKMAYAPSLTPFHNAARFALTTNQWLDVMAGAPFPTLTIDLLETYREVLRRLIDEFKICRLDKKDHLEVSVSEDVMTCCENDGELPSILLHLVASLPKTPPTFSILVPWTGVTCYWASRRDSRPTMRFTRASPRTGDRRAQLLSPQFTNGAVPAAIASVAAAIKTMFSAASTLGNPFAALQAWELENLVLLSTLQTFCSFGLATHWYMHVAREDLSECVLDAAVYGRSLLEIARWTLGPRSEWLGLLRVHVQMMAHARAIIIAQGRDTTFEPQQAIYSDVISPFKAYIMMDMGVYRATMTELQLVAAVVAQQLAPQVWLHLTRTWDAHAWAELFQAKWCALTMPPLADDDAATSLQAEHFMSD